ncbi:RNA-binding domain-containing protein [Brachybacterium phenoliresistens]|uniref:RNA-binding domain-containing protein n=1 Tax=Brachybacterium phenoliresistens TaxID=396014 RepID=UPI0031CF396C
MSITREQLDAVLDELRIHRGDSTDVEVKRAAGGLPESIGETLCAFANMPDGGLVVLGVSEAGDFSITGVPDSAAIESGLASVAQNAVVPSPHLRTATIDYDGIQVVTVRVTGLPPSMKPARYRGIAYLRQADGDYAMSPAALHMLEVEKLHTTERTQYDLAAVPGSSLDDLDEDLLHAFLRRARASSRRLRDQTDLAILRQMGVATSAADLTVAGLYALGNYPQGKFPAFEVTAAVRLPRDGGPARTQNLRHFDGPLPDLLEGLLSWVSSNLTTRQEYQPDGHMRNVPELPLRAVREALANALVHRDLGPDSLGAGLSVDVRITDQALIIASPGGLRGVTLSQITSGGFARAAVNQRLYAIARLLRTDDGQNIIEGEGGGVSEILRSAVESDLHRPKLVDTGVQFRALLWRGSAFSTEDRAWLRRAAGDRALTHLQKQVLIMTRDGEPWDIDSLRDAFSPMSAQEAVDQISQLSRWNLADVDIEASPPMTLAPDGTAQASPMPLELASGPIPVHNGPLILDALGQDALTVRELEATTGLSVRQVRYALTSLMERGLVRRDGGQGRRGTTYARIDAASA